LNNKLSSKELNIIKSLSFDLAFTRETAH